MYREKAIFMVAAGVLVLLAHGVDLLQAHGPNWPALGIRLTWGILLMLEAAALRWGGTGTIRMMSILGAMGTVALYLALLAVTGRSSSPLFPFSYVLVMILPMVLVELMAVALASAALLLAGTWAMLVLDAARPGELLGWIHVGVVAFSVSWLLALASRRMYRAQEAQRTARQQALEQLHASLQQNQTLVSSLQDALANVQTLSGLLPICSFCKKIRNDQGYWERIEAYVTQHSQARFSHSFCPECARTHYGEG